MEPIPLFLVESHQMIRQAWEMILGNESRYRIVQSSGDTCQSLITARESSPGIVILDLETGKKEEYGYMPLISRFAERHQVLAVSVFAEPALVKQVFKAGATGYISKSASLNEFRTALQELSQGRRFICHEVKDKLADAKIAGEKEGLSSLTPRELEIARAVKEGFSSTDIAVLFDIALKTVEAHRFNILRKLGVRNTTAMINLIHSWGL